MLKVGAPSSYTGNFGLDTGYAGNCYLCFSSVSPKEDQVVC
jgi:hypothetical protein